MKNNMKKISTVLFAGALCLTLLNGCGSSKPDSPASPAQSESTDHETSLPSENSGQETSSQSDNPDDFQQSTSSDAPVSEFTGPSVGPFTTQDVNGNTVTDDIFKDYDLTLVNIFTTWCSPCVAEIPELEKLRDEVADKGVNVIGVVLDVLDEKGEIVQESLERAQLLAEETGATYPFLLPDPTYMNGRLTGIEAFPETFFVDKNGNVVGGTYSGSGGLEDWLAVVEQELASLKETR